MAFDFEYTQELDTDRERVFEMDTGTKVFFRRIPSYGFWKVSFEKGGVPDSLSGHFTSFAAARKQLEIYLTSRRNPSNLVEVTPEEED